MMQHSIESNKLNVKRQFSTIHKGFFILEISTALIISLIMLYALFSYCTAIKDWLVYARTYQQAHHALQTSLLSSNNGSQTYAWGRIDWRSMPCTYDAQLCLVSMIASWSDAHNSMHTISMVYAL